MYENMAKTITKLHIKILLQPKKLTHTEYCDEINSLNIYTDNPYRKWYLIYDIISLIEVWWHICVPLLVIIS